MAAEKEFTTINFHRSVYRLFSDHCKEQGFHIARKAEKILMQYLLDWDKENKK